MLACGCVYQGTCIPQNGSKLDSDDKVSSLHMLHSWRTCMPVPMPCSTMTLASTLGDMCIRPCWTGGNHVGRQPTPTSAPLQLKKQLPVHSLKAIHVHTVLLHQSNLAGQLLKRLQHRCTTCTGHNLICRYAASIIQFGGLFS